MFKHSVVIPLLLPALAVPFVWAQSGPELPPSPMQGKAIAACTQCHEVRIILQQHLGKAAWTKEVDKMIKWGAPVDPQDRDPLIDYLTANFGVDKPEYVAERTQSAARKQKR